MAAHPCGHQSAGVFGSRVVRADARAHPSRSAAAGRRTQRRMSPMPPLIEAHDLSKNYGKHVALDHVNFAVETGRIVGLIGPNGAGKTTALRAILGLTPYSGELTVLGLDPRTQRDALMREVCFMADVAVLPRWLRVSQALEVVSGVHPRF